MADLAGHGEGFLILHKGNMKHKQGTILEFLHTKDACAAGADIQNLAGNLILAAIVDVGADLRLYVGILAEEGAAVLALQELQVFDAPELRRTFGNGTVQRKRLGVLLEAPKLDFLLVIGNWELCVGFGADLQDAAAADVQNADKQEVVMWRKNLDLHPGIQLRDFLGRLGFRFFGRRFLRLRARGWGCGFEQ